jgi:hypothetical protein
MIPDGVTDSSDPVEWKINRILLSREPACFHRSCGLKRFKYWYFALSQLVFGVSMDVNREASRNWLRAFCKGFYNHVKPWRSTPAPRRADLHKCVVFNGWCDVCVENFQ